MSPTVCMDACRLRSLSATVDGGFTLQVSRFTDGRLSCFAPWRTRRPRWSGSRHQMASVWKLPVTRVAAAAGGRGGGPLVPPAGRRHTTISLSPGCFVEAVEIYGRRDRGPYRYSQGWRDALKSAVAMTMDSIIVAVIQDSMP